MRWPSEVWCGGGAVAKPVGATGSGWGTGTHPLSRWRANLPFIMQGVCANTAMRSDM